MKDRKILFGIGLAGIGGYALYRMLKAPPKPGKKPRGPVGATLNFMHKGMAETVWIGFGIGPAEQDPVTMSTDQWVGAFFDIDEHDEETLCFVEVEGIFPSLPVKEGDWVDCLKIILPYPIDPTKHPLTAEEHDKRYDSDWDSEVYEVLGGT